MISDQRFPLGSLVVAWLQAKEMLSTCVNVFSPNMPLWHNSLLAALTDNLDLVKWAKKGVKYLADLFHDGVFVSFATLQETHQLTIYS